MFSGHLKTGEKKGWPHPTIQFIGCTKYPAQGRSEGGNPLTKLHLDLARGVSEDTEMVLLD